MSDSKLGQDAIGLTVEKKFGGKLYKGWVRKYFREEELYHVTYEDDDEEDVDFNELKKIMRALPKQTKAAAGRRGPSGSAPPAKTRRRSTRVSGPAVVEAGSAEGSKPQEEPKKPKKPKKARGAAITHRGSEERVPHPVSPGTAAAETLFTMSSAPESPPCPQRTAWAAAPTGGSPRRRQKMASTTQLHSPAGGAGSAHGKRTAAAAAAPPVAAQRPAKKSQSAPKAAALAGALANDVAGPSSGPQASQQAAASEPAPAKAHRTSRLNAREAVEYPYKGVDILRSMPQNGGRPGNPRFNGANYFQNTVYLAGQIATDTRAPGGDTYYGQTKQVLGQVEELLARSGSSMQRILQVTIHLRDIEEGADEFNEAWGEVMDPKHLPARTTVQAHLMRPDLLVEATVIAAVKPAQD